MTKREKDRLQHRIAYASLGAVVAVSLAIIVVVAVYNVWVYPNQSVAWVNGHGISRTDRDVMTKYYTAAQAQATAQGSQLQGDPQSLAVEQLQKSLLTQIAAQQKLGITASNSEADAQLTTAIGSNGARFTSLLQQYGISRADYVRLIEVPRLLDQKVGVALTKNDALTAPQWHYARISVKTQAAATSILQQLSKGASFATLAKKLSQDTTSAPQGGDLGWERLTDGSDPLLTSTFLPYLQKMQKSGTKYQVVKYSSSVWYVLELLGYDSKHKLTSTQVQADQVTAFNTWVKPIQDSANFNPVLPANPVTSSTGSGSL